MDHGVAGAYQVIRLLVCNQSHKKYHVRAQQYETGLQTYFRMLLISYKKAISMVYVMLQIVIKIYISIY